MVRALKQRIEQTPTKPNCGERHARFVGLPDFAAALRMQDSSIVVLESVKDHDFYVRAVRNY